MIAIMLATTSCGGQSDPLNAEKFDKIDSTISIQIPGEFEKPETGSNAIVSPNGKGTFHHKNKMHKIGKAVALRERVIEILGPLQNYSGTMDQTESPKEAMECGSRSSKFGIGLIFWDFDPSKATSDATVWRNVSQYDFSCNAPKAVAATARIEAAIKLFEDHVASAE